MGIQGISHTSDVALVKIQAHTKGNNRPTDAGSFPPESEDATQVDISDEAKQLSQLADETDNAGHGPANPHDVAESLGYKNFGQLVKALKASDSNNSVSVSELVHGDANALNAAQQALATEEATITDDSSTLESDLVTDPQIPSDPPPDTTSSTDPLTDAPVSSDETPSAISIPLEIPTSLETPINSTSQFLQDLMALG
jgi:hypothetical protein